MRTSPLVALGLLLVLAAPVVSASSSTLRLAARETTTEQAGVVPIVVALRVEDILCSEEKTFTVTLEASGDGSASGTFEATTLAFPVEARSYFVTPYEGQSIANLSVRGTGAIEVTATFQPEEGVCFAPGGIPGAVAQILVEVGPAQAPIDPPPQEPTPATNATTEEPAPSQPTPTEPTPEESTSPTSTPTASGNTVCAPETSCGYIGDYAGNAPTESSREAPGLGTFLVLGVVGIVAMGLRRRR